MSSSASRASEKREKGSSHKKSTTNKQSATSNSIASKQKSIPSGVALGPSSRGKGHQGRAAPPLFTPEGSPENDSSEEELSDDELLCQLDPPMRKYVERILKRVKRRNLKEIEKLKNALEAVKAESKAAALLKNQPCLVPRPRGEAGRTGGRGFDLAVRMGVSGTRLNRLRRVVEGALIASPEITFQERFTDIPPSTLDNLATELTKTVPILGWYEGHWAFRELAKQVLAARRRSRNEDILAERNSRQEPDWAAIEVGEDVLPEDESLSPSARLREKVNVNGGQTVASEEDDANGSDDGIKDESDGEGIVDLSKRTHRKRKERPQSEPDKRSPTGKKARLATSLPIRRFGNLRRAAGPEED